MLEGATFAIAGATVFGDEGWTDCFTSGRY